jgi:hypothetical protein
VQNANDGHFCKSTESLIELFQDSICRIKIVRGNEFPYLLKIAKSSLGEFEAHHPWCRRRSVL